MWASTMPGISVAPAPSITVTSGGGQGPRPAAHAHDAVALHQHLAREGRGAGAVDDAHVGEQHVAPWAVSPSMLHALRVEAPQQVVAFAGISIGVQWPQRAAPRRRAPRRSARPSGAPPGRRHRVLVAGDEQRRARDPRRIGGLRIGEGLAGARIAVGGLAHERARAPPPPRPAAASASPSRPSPPAPARRRCPACPPRLRARLRRRARAGRPRRIGRARERTEEREAAHQARRGRRRGARPRWCPSNARPRARAPRRAAAQHAQHRLARSARSTAAPPPGPTGPSRAGRGARVRCRDQRRQDGVHVFEVPPRPCTISTASPSPSISTAMRSMNCVVMRSAAASGRGQAPAAARGAALRLPVEHAVLHHGEEARAGPAARRGWPAGRRRRGGDRRGSLP